jgi:energy-coupling factor transporter ATP-binding protein EcfA2
LLKSIKISRFRSVHEQKIDFGKVNLFIGPNGSGKSNVLEALGVLSAALSQGLDPVALDLRGVRLSLPHLFKSAFKNHDLPKTFRLEAEFENGRYECSIRAGTTGTFLEFFSEALYNDNVQVFGRSMHGTKLHSASADVKSFDASIVGNSRSVWSIISPLVKISDKFRSELDEFSRFAIYSPQTAIMRGLAVDNRVVEPLGLTGSGLAQALKSIQLTLPKGLQDKILKIIWEPGWTNMVQTGPFNASIVPRHVRSEGTLLYMRDRYMRAGRDMLSAFDASEGTLYLIFVATLLGHKDTPNAFALDNVDGTLNPRLVRKLTDHIVNIVCGDVMGVGHQVFMTSHHPSSLDSFDIFDKDHRIFVCSRQNEETQVVGGSLFSPMLPPEKMEKDEWNLKHKGANLSEIFLRNRIPNAL